MNQQKSTKKDIYINYSYSESGHIPLSMISRSQAVAQRMRLLNAQLWASRRCTATICNQSLTAKKFQRNHQATTNFSQLQGSCPIFTLLWLSINEKQQIFLFNRWCDSYVGCLCELTPIFTADFRFTCVQRFFLCNSSCSIEDNTALSKL